MSYFFPVQPAISHGRPEEFHLRAEPRQPGGDPHQTQGGPHARRLQDQPALHGAVDFPGRFEYFLRTQVFLDLTELIPTSGCHQLDSKVTQHKAALDVRLGRFGARRCEGRHKSPLAGTRPGRDRRSAAGSDSESTTWYIYFIKHSFIS